MVRCSTCGAKPVEKCELSTGMPRTGPALGGLRKVMGPRIGVVHAINPNDAAFIAHSAAVDRCLRPQA
jgi:hypothetical protein